MHHVAGHGLNGELVSRFDTGLELAIKQTLADRNGVARLGQNALQHVFELGVERLIGHDAIDQATRQRLLGRDEVAGEQHLERLFGQYVARQGHAGRRTKQAQVDAVDTKAGRLRGQRQITLRHQLTTGGGGQPLHACDHWQLQLAYAQHQPRAARKQGLVVGQVGVGAHFPEIMTRTKSPAVGGNHQRARALVAGHRIERALQRVQHGGRQRVEVARRIQRERVHAAHVALMQQDSIGWVGTHRRHPA